MNAYLMFFSMGVMGLWKVRRKHFELFYHLHMITFCSLTVAVIWHAASAWCVETRARRRPGASEAGAGETGFRAPRFGLVPEPAATRV